MQSNVFSFLGTAGKSVDNRMELEGHNDDLTGIHSVKYDTT